MFRYRFFFSRYIIARRDRERTCRLCVFSDITRGGNKTDDREKDGRTASGSYEIAREEAEGNNLGGKKSGKCFVKKKKKYLYKYINEGKNVGWRG